jgi:hypothetical protein
MAGALQERRRPDAEIAVALAAAGHHERQIERRDLLGRARQRLAGRETPRRGDQRRGEHQRQRQPADDGPAHAAVLCDT